MSDKDLQQTLSTLLSEGMHLGAFPSAGAFVAQGGILRATAFCGQGRPDTLWDVASLTKPMAIGELAMKAVSDGTLDLDESLIAGDTDSPKIRELLAHRAGFPPWDDLYGDVSRTFESWTPGSVAVRSQVKHRVAALRDDSRSTRYSDLGYMTLGWFLEQRLGGTLDQLVTRWPWSNQLSTEREATRCLTNGFCEQRRRELRAEVNDLNCHVMGGVGGHAGLFSRLQDVGHWGLELLNADKGRTAGRDPGVIRTFWDPANRSHGETWVMGWDTPTPGNSTAGCRISTSSVGHLGFTGTSIWIDREADVVVVLLSNRVALGPESKATMRGFRPVFHDGIFERLGKS